MSRELSQFLLFLQDTYRTRGLGPSLPAPPLAEIGRGGSPRRFWRVGTFPRSVVGMFHPDPPVSAVGVSENDAFFYVQRHLQDNAIAVPRLLAVDLPRGWFVMEDLGPESLYDHLAAHGARKAHEWLVQAVQDLARIHARASRGFDTTRTHNEEYTAAFARQRESGYFQHSFLREELGLDPQPLDGELDELASRLDEFWTPHFLYRDFQSQNIALKDERLRYFDFQGARRGPRQYDLASLVFDPYLELPSGLQACLMESYMEEAVREDASFDDVVFRSGFPFVAIHRLMQTLGAYGFLSRHMKKVHFRQHMPAAVRLLGRLMDEHEPLRSFARLCRRIRALEEHFTRIT